MGNTTGVATGALYRAASRRRVTSVEKTTKAAPPKKRPACRRRRVAGSREDSGIVREEEDLGTMLGRMDFGGCAEGEVEDGSRGEDSGSELFVRFVAE